MFKILIYLGIILKKNPDNFYNVFIPSIAKNISCYLSGRMRINYIKIIPGDKVKIELDSSNYNKGRIISRIL